MKLLHFSDLHLGVENFGTLDASSGVSTRVLDFLRAFDLIVDRAVAERVDAVLFSGDAFKNRDPSPTLQREFARRVVRIVNAGIPFVILIGNHDLPNVFSRATPVEIYAVLGLPGVHVCRGIERVDVATPSGLLQVIAVPWTPRSALLAQDQVRELSDAEIDRTHAQAIAGAVRALAEELDPTRPAVLMAHVSIQGATVGYEQSIMLGRDITVGLDDLRAAPFDYVALGHIHKHQALGVKPPAVYAGSPERIDFGEEMDDKGFVLVEIEETPDGRRTSWSFERLPARPFVTLKVDARSAEDPHALARSGVERELRRVDGAIVRCFVEVDPGRERAVNANELRRVLLDAGAAYVAHVTVQSETTLRAREMIGEEHARDAARMLDRWVEGRRYDARLRERVLARGGELIARRQQQTGGSGERG